MKIEIITPSRVKELVNKQFKVRERELQNTLAYHQNQIQRLLDEVKILSKKRKKK